MTLKSELKNDIWKILDQKNNVKRYDDFFLLYIIRFLLGKEKISMREVHDISVKVKKEYNKILSEASEELILGDILNTITSSQDKLEERVKPIIEGLLIKLDKTH